MDKQGYKYAIGFDSDRPLSSYPELGEDKKKLKVKEQNGRVYFIILCNEIGGYFPYTDEELRDIVEWEEV